MMAREFDISDGPAPTRARSRTVLLLVLLAFVGGLIAMGWVASRWDMFDRAGETAPPPPSSGEDRAVAALDRRVGPDGRVAAPAVPPMRAAGPDALVPATELGLALRVAELESRLTRLDLQAQAASGNAARAEGMLVAFAARRALDRGQPLGYLEGQLQLRFGEGQPNAVGTIIDAAQQPVTLDRLRMELEELGPKITGPAEAQDFWSGIQRELATLFVVRRAGSPSPEPERRLDRALAALEADKVEVAIEEVRRLPAHARAAGWLRRAERFVAVRQALDFIETAAILDSRELRDASGAAVRQPSPLATPPVTGPVIGPVTGQSEPGA